VYFKEVFAFTQKWIYLLGAGMSGAAFASGILMGFITDRAGAKNTMVVAALFLIGAIATVGVVPVAWIAVGAITVAGTLGLTGLWVAGRKLLIELAPPDRLGEYFGLYGITIKVSVIGTLVFGILVDLLPDGGHWNFRLAILVQLIMIVPGVFLLRAVKPTGPPPEGNLDEPGSATRAQT
jgi:UMF1 family MFS transporter